MSDTLQTQTNQDIPLLCSSAQANRGRTELTTHRLILSKHLASKIVKDVRLRLQMDCQREFRYQTHLVVLPERQSSGAEWTELRHHIPRMERRDDIPALASAVIVGVLEEPFFKKSQVISVTGAVFYKQLNSNSERSFQDILSPAVEFKVEDLVKGKLKPFASLENCEGSDLISVVVNSDYRILRVSPRHCLPVPTLPLQLSTHGLLEVPSLHCWVGHAHGSLEGLVVTVAQLRGSDHRLDLYARNMKQALQLVHSLSNQWKVELLEDTDVSLQTCIKSFAGELKLLRSTVLPNASIPSEQWAEIRKQLSDLELKTDINFSSHLPE